MSTDDDRFVTSQEFIALCETRLGITFPRNMTRCTITLAGNAPARVTVEVLCGVGDIDGDLSYRMRHLVLERNGK